MKQIQKLSFLALLGFFMMQAPAMALTAPDRGGKLDLGVGVSGVLSSEDQVEDTAFYGANLSFGINRWLAIGVDAGYQDTSLSDDDLTMIPVFADVIVRLPNESNLVPYALFGLGAISFDLDNDNNLRELDDETSFAMKAGLGVDIFVNEHWAFFVEGDYVWTNNEVDFNNPGGNISLDYWTLGGGLKFVF